jgi:hypothetical protein
MRYFVAIPLYCDVMKFIFRKHQVPFHLIWDDNEEVALPHSNPALLAGY